jgi:hypothetical protein
MKKLCEGSVNLKLSKWDVIFYSILGVLVVASIYGIATGMMITTFSLLPSYLIIAIMKFQNDSMSKPKHG